MRILLVSGPARGGMLTWVHEAARVLSRGHGAVALAAPFTLPGVVGLTAYPLAVGEGVLPGRDVTHGLQLAARAFGADLVHAHGLRAGYAALRSGLPFAYTLHGFPPAGAQGVLFRLGEARVMRSARAVSAVSEALSLYGRKAGCPCPVLAPLPAVAERPLPLPAGAPVFGTLARLSPEKGVDVLLTAFSYLEPGRTGVRLLVGGDGPERARLEALAASLGISHATSFLGWVDDREGFFRQLAVYVQPSRREGFGLAAREAASAGRPLVVSAAGGLPAAAGSGPWARCVPPGDATALAAAMAELAEADLAGLGAAAHAFAAREARQDAFGEGLIAFYASALGEAKTGD